MPIKAQEWSVVVVGHWNRAILTPAGVVKRLFNLPETTPVTVEVALDAFLPYRIRHENVTVTPNSDRLSVQPMVCDFDTLGQAIEATRNALQGLPETPVFAAGFNLNFKTKDYVESLADIVRHPWDDRLVDKDLKIHTRSIGRALDWRGGLIKVTVGEEPEGVASVYLNYERRSNVVSDLIEWLSIPIDDIRNQTELILTGCLDLAPGEINYGA